MPVSIQNRQRTVAIRTPEIKKCLQYVLSYLDCADCELSVLFAGDRLVQCLNRTYRAQDHPTNVLAFPQQPPGAGGPAVSLLGDIVVSLPTAAREAQSLRQPVEERVLYLLIHGLLHLLGYDHERSAAERLRMEEREHDILRHLNRWRSP